MSHSASKNGNPSYDKDKDKDNEAKAFIQGVFESPKVKQLDQRLNRLEKIIDAFLMAGTKE